MKLREFMKLIEVAWKVKKLREVVKKLMEVVRELTEHSPRTRITIELKV